MNRKVDCSAFSDLALEWFREGDALGDGTDGKHVEYVDDKSPLRARLETTGIAVGSLILGFLALGWLAT